MEAISLEERQLLIHSPCGVGVHTAPHSRTVDCEDGHPQGWPLLFDPSPSGAIRAPCTLLPDVHKPQYHVEVDSMDLGHYDPAFYCR